MGLNLAEKWFLATKLGASAWSVNTEKILLGIIVLNITRNISMGYNYYTLKWDRCIPFLLMLPGAFDKQDFITTIFSFTFEFIMIFSSKLIEDAVQEFSRLLGIGKKTALRMVLSSYCVWTKERG